MEVRVKKLKILLLVSTFLSSFVYAQETGLTSRSDNNVTTVSFDEIRENINRSRFPYDQATDAAYYSNTYQSYTQLWKKLSVVNAQKAPYELLMHALSFGGVKAWQLYLKKQGRTADATIPLICYALIVGLYEAIKNYKMDYPSEDEISFRVHKFLKLFVYNTKGLLVLLTALAAKKAVTHFYKADAIIKTAMNKKGCAALAITAAFAKIFKSEKLYNLCFSFSVQFLEQKYLPIFLSKACQRISFLNFNSQKDNATLYEMSRYYANNAVGFAIINSIVSYLKENFGFQENNYEGVSLLKKIELGLHGIKGMTSSIFSQIADDELPFFILTNAFAQYSGLT